MTWSGEIVRLTTLSSDQAAVVRELAERTGHRDGVDPLNEAALLALRHGRPGVEHRLATTGPTLVGYGQRELSDPPVGQLFVDPDHRAKGIGSQLLSDLLVGSRNLQVWAAGDSAAAQALAQRANLIPKRELLIMERTLHDRIDAPKMSKDVTIDAFIPGADEAVWLAVNAAAFAHHPEQGSLTVTDLAERMAEPWFDPQGLFMARVDGEVVGFHWTKQHPDGLGEVYVLGVAPAAAGAGLGKALLLTGLAHLRAKGNQRVVLYVEADNRPAVGLYEGYGFDTVKRDVMYAAG